MTTLYYKIREMSTMGLTYTIVQLFHGFIVIETNQQWSNETMI